MHRKLFPDWAVSFITRRRQTVKLLPLLTDRSQLTPGLDLPVDVPLPTNSSLDFIELRRLDAVKRSF